MACRGVHFGLTDDDVAILCACSSDDERLEHITEVIEERDCGGPWGVETDKAWDAIHRCFAAGRLDPDGGEYPLNHVILGGESMYDGDDYIMSWKSPQQVREIAEALKRVNETDFRASYRRIDPDDYGIELSDEDEGYTWEWFTGLVDLYQRAADEGRSVLFTVDQ